MNLKLGSYFLLTAASIINASSPKIGIVTISGYNSSGLRCGSATWKNDENTSMEVRIFNEIRMFNRKLYLSPRIMVFKSIRHNHAKGYAITTTSLEKDITTGMISPSEFKDEYSSKGIPSGGREYSSRNLTDEEKAPLYKELSRYDITSKSETEIKREAWRRLQQTGCLSLGLQATPRRK